MKINKSKSPFAGGINPLDEKEPLQSIKSTKFAEALNALENTDASSESNATRTAFAEIARQYDLSDENSRDQALQKSSEFLVQTRLSEEDQKKGTIVADLSRYIAADPQLKNKLLTVLQKLRDS